MSERDKPTDNPFAEQLSAMTRGFTTLVEQNQSMMSSFLEASRSMGSMPETDPLNVGPAFSGAMTGLARDPQKLMQANYELWKQHMELWQEIAMRVFREMPDDPDGADRDRRFRHEDWSKNPLFEYIRKS